MLRLLPSNNKPRELTTLGLSTLQQQQFIDSLAKPQGVILVTGPTGSGKTTTLYSGLHHLNNDEKNICTIEDPIEITLSGLNQVAVNDAIGLTYPSALRSFLRQDPDVMMIGEIRDELTANIAFSAGQTGHLVLSTLHTNSAIETLQRLTTMGVERYHLAYGINSIMAQRLLRKLCVRCKKKMASPALTNTHVTPNHAPLNDASPNHLPANHALENYARRHNKSDRYEQNPLGCQYCRGGFAGRLAVYELLPFRPSLQQYLLRTPHIDNDQIAALANIPSLYQMGLEKVYQGETSLSELHRVLSAPPSMQRC